MVAATGAVEVTHTREEAVEATRTAMEVTRADTPRVVVADTADRAEVKVASGRCQFHGTGHCMRVLLVSVSCPLSILMVTNGSKLSESFWSSVRGPMVSVG